MRAAAVALVSILLGVQGADARPIGPKVAFRDGGIVRIAGATGGAAHAAGAPRWSGNGRTLSVGGRIVGGPRLGAGTIAWAPAGATAAFQAPDGAVYTWSSAAGRKLVVPASWGATSFAWGPGAVLALGRSAPGHQEVWIRRDGRLTRVAGPLPGVQRPLVAAVTADGTPLWWSDLEDSASIAADGLPLYAGGEQRLGVTLVYPDYVTVCGPHLALAVGRDRYAMHGKRILFDGRDVSRDPSRSWVSPSCSADGRTLVAAASANTVPPRIGREHRAIWQLLPVRRRLTHPPTGRTDEFPRVLADGSVLFVRTRTVSKPTELYGVGTVEVLRGGRLHALGTASRADDFYGHYAWPDVVAVAP